MMRILMSDRSALTKLPQFICFKFAVLILVALLFFQAAVYGLGVCAEFGGPVFKHLVGGISASFLTGFDVNVLYSINNNQGLCPEALSRLNVVIRHPNALEPDNVMAYDNAVSALGKICQFHRDSVDSAQVFPSPPNKKRKK